MWKKACKFIMNTIIVVGSILSVFSAIASGAISFSILEAIAIQANAPDLESIAIVTAIGSGLINLIIGLAITFLSVIGMGFIIEIADDIEQIRINTTPKKQTPVQQPQSEGLDINKYIYPYQ